MVSLLKNCVRTLWQESKRHRINRRVALQMRRIWEAWAVVEWVVKAEAVDIDLLLVTLTKEIQIWEIQICQGLQT